MVELMVSLGKLFIGFLSMLGPLALLLAIQHTRDRRAAALSTTVLRELNSPHLRGLFSVKIKTNPFKGGVVAVDLWNCSRDQVWDILQRLSAQLASHVRVEVNGISDGRTRSPWTLTVTRKSSSVACCSG